MLVNRLSVRHAESEASESDLGRFSVGAAITANLMGLVGGLSAPLYLAQATSERNELIHQVT